MIDEAFGRGSDDSTRYALELFRKLSLQLLIVTPMQKTHIIEDYVQSVHFIHNEEGKNSMIRNLTIEEYKEEKASYQEGEKSSYQREEKGLNQEERVSYQRESLNQEEKVEYQKGDI